MDPKSLTLRIPKSLYERLLRRKKSTVTAFVLEALEEKIEREREEEIAKAFECLAEDFDQEESAYWQKVQREAMRHVDD